MSGVAAVLVAAAVTSEPVRVRPPVGAAFRPMWCDLDFSLDPSAPECMRSDLHAAEGAFVIHGVLSRNEAARMVAAAEAMGFERGDGDAAGRSNRAVSWCFHDALCEQLVRRIARHVPWGVAVHAPGTEAPRPERLPSVQGRSPWVRQIGGVPEGLYTLDGLNCRMRLYCYESGREGEGSDGVPDRFLPHYDEVWPGSRVVFDGDEPVLEQDAWRYADGPTAEATRAWSWAEGDCVSHLTVLLYLNDDFAGGETVLYPGEHASEEPAPGALRVDVRPVAGSMLCFGQSFRFNRALVEHAADALLHEGAPVRPASEGRASRKYILRTDVCYTMPRR
jgi:hypothetical protein